ncbi:hypothetical protein M6D81_26275 [Paenibacillus sp. J5C_2022]|uniref:hypothetical protein n=1 Tax=Paenibacillus sp. J5C2022 TaxID=2977129 RepID=UPI0021D38D02|nr:hypothetical protein [Paenibacillus sp. J5C2022]MCU6712212.1 hypothetical protein [Paenibacillus sp. J5C2022]
MPHGLQAPGKISKTNGLTGDGSRTKRKDMSRRLAHGNPGISFLSLLDRQEHEIPRFSA